MKRTSSNDYYFDSLNARQTQEKQKPTNKEAPVKEKDFPKKKEKGLKGPKFEYKKKETQDYVKKTSISSKQNIKPTNNIYELLPKP